MLRVRRTWLEFGLPSLIGGFRLPVIQRLDACPCPGTHELDSGGLGGGSCGVAKKQNQEGQSRRVRLYAELHRLNRHFAKVAEDLVRLRQAVPQSKFLKSYQSEAEEIWARINFEITDALRDIEEKHWTRLGTSKPK